MHGNNSIVSFIVTGLVIVLIVGLRMRRMGRNRPLRLDQLWVLPAIFLAITAISFVQAPPDQTGWELTAAGLVVGAVIGWYRGRLTKIEVDPATGRLNQRASPGALILLLALILIRFGLRTVLASEAATWHVGAAAIVDAFLAFALGIIALQRLEMYLRGRKLLAEAQAGRPQA